ncbi:hypothetical protein VAPA_2c10140 [Variovorax paradoxus B4]|uniref:Uncharacterized protein n=1 Tax=Variovorax paradoxus B4 TaxID=1246301 RepID=T1XN82_VARPD|nr:hypothetical protein VAPA_2c10140 [Variovorax paradoxus B4]
MNRNQGHFSRRVRMQPEKDHIKIMPFTDGIDQAEEMLEGDMVNADHIQRRVRGRNARLRRSHGM